MKWGLAIISMGGTLVMISQLPPTRDYLIMLGLLLMTIGFLIFSKGKKEL